MQRPARLSDVLLPGAIGGMLAGLVVGLWFFGVDLIAGRPLTTPAVLGQIVMQLPEFNMSWRLLAGYTVLHFGVFVVLGVAAAWFMRAFQLAPGLLLGLVFGVVVLDVVYYGALLVTGGSVLEVLAWYEVVPANALAGMAFMAYLHRVFHEERPIGWGVLRGHPLPLQGIMTGAIGAGVVAAWFLVLDTLAGRPFHTPAALASALFVGAQGESDIHVTLGLLAGYTMLHLAAFVAAGVVIAAAATYLERMPSRVLLVALAMLMVEAAVVSLLLLSAEWVMGSVGLWAITVANILAVVAMTWFAWRAHPALPERLRHATVDV